MTTNVWVRQVKACVFVLIKYLYYFEIKYKLKRNGLTTNYVGIQRFTAVLRSSTFPV